MRDKSIIPTNLPDWPRVAGLLPELKLILGLGFWGGRYTNSIGIATIPVRPLAASLGLDPAALECGIKTLCSVGSLLPDWQTFEFFICDWFRFHTFAGVGVSIARRELLKVNSLEIRGVVTSAAPWIAHQHPISDGKATQKQAVSLPTAAATASSSAAKVRDRRTSGIVTFLAGDVERAERLEKEFEPDAINRAVSAIEKRNKEPVPGVVRKEVECQIRRALNKDITVPQPDSPDFKGIDKEQIRQKILNAKKILSGNSSQ